MFAASPPPLDLDDLGSDPDALFTRWLAEALAIEVLEPHAMTLSTVDPDGRPDARMLILKDLGDGAWSFATDLHTSKAAQLAQAPYVALTFYWPELGRQVRVRGPVHLGARETSAADFGSRGSRAQAVVRAVAALSDGPPGWTREDLVRAVDALQAQPVDRDQAAPDSWATYAVAAETVEFWQADPGRLHLRVRYARRHDEWTHTLLAH